MDDEHTQLSICVAADGALSLQGLMGNHGSGPTLKQSEGQQRKQVADPFPQALDGRPDDAACYLHVAADSKPRLAEMHGVLQAPPPMLSSARNI